MYGIHCELVGFCMAKNLSRQGSGEYIEKFGVSSSLLQYMDSISTLRWLNLTKSQSAVIK